MVDNQHKKITGYRDLSEAEIALINEGKALSETVGVFMEKLEKSDFAQTREQEPDRRWLAIARTDLQKGFMALIRSIAKPTTF